MNANTTMTSSFSDSPSDMVRRLRGLAATRPGDTALTVVHRAGETRLDYADLDRRSRALAAQLQRRFAPGDRALLLLDNDQHYVVAFFACLYAGLVAVPVFPPESAREQHLARLVGIAADCQARGVLTSQAILDLVGQSSEVFGTAVSLAVDAIDEAQADDWREHTPRPSDIAFLQYTSGSTATPKGVMVTHANLMANERAIEESLAMQDDDVFVSWLPLYHDMGLIGGLLQPVHRGIPLVLMSPGFFLERPARWLEAVSRHRGTISGGPDFAYRLCLERIKDEQLAALDLSSWRLAFSGAEPVRHDTLEEFVAHFAPAGFAADAVYPCYGLAEATLLVTGGRRGSGLTARPFSAGQLARGVAVPEADGTMLVGCGQVPSLHELRIVEPVTLAVLDEGQIGEIWASGPSIAQGYWERHEASLETFVERDGLRWLRTGDLGFTHEGQLYVAGRRKDLIILRGHNVYPQDIERAIEAEVEAVRKGRVAAFAVPTADGGEGVGVAVEVSRGLQKLVPPQALVEALSLAVSAACHEPVTVALLLNPGALPKTSSGKLQRSACRQGWQSRSLDAYAIHEHGRFVVGGDAALAAVVAAVDQGEAPSDDLEATLAGLWRQALRKDAQVPLGRNAHFFTLGGNSLSAAQLASRISDQWGVDFSVRAVFEHARLGELAAQIRQALKAVVAVSRPARPALLPLSSERRAGLLPLSHAQARQWFLWRLAPQSTAYHLGGALRLSGPLDADALQAGFDALVRRHESLRTVFESNEDGVAMQRILPPAAFDLSKVDWRGVASSTERESLAAQSAQALHDQPFDLSHGPLWRASLIQLADQVHLLAVVAHHIVADGASMQIFLDELAALTLAQAQGMEASLASLPVQCADHAAWQRQWVASGEHERQLAYWRQALGGDQPVLALPTDHPRTAVAQYQAARHVLTLPAELVTALRQLAHGQGHSLFMALLAGFQALLHRHTGQEDLRVGVPVANRHRTQTEGLIGFLVNTQVLRSRVHGRLTLAQLLDQVRDVALEAQAHQDLPFDQLVDALQPERSLGYNPLFQVMFNHLIEAPSALERLPGITVTSHPLHASSAQFELTLDTTEQPDGRVQATLTYARELFEPERIERMAGHYLQLLEALAHAPQHAIGDVELLSDAEQVQLRQWGRHEQRHPVDHLVHALIERQAAAQPEATALVFGDQVLSYQQLNEQANRLAHHLIAQGVGPDVKVGIALERAIDMVVAPLAVLKAGGAYVPLDPDYPAERLAHMIEDSGLQLLLTQSHLIEKLSSDLSSQAGLTTLTLDELDLSQQTTANPGLPTHPSSLAYVIYTSGSTGKPKGVGIAHHALAEHTQVAIGFAGLTAQDRMLQFATLSFDSCVEQLYPPLCAGAAIVLRGPALWDSETFYHQLIDQGISVADLTTAYWMLLAQDFARHGVRTYGALRQVHVGGEAMPPEGLRAWREAGLGAVKLLNAYGPTEATVTATVLDCTPYVNGERPLPTQVPIGQPLAGRHLHVLDADLNPVPPGVVGELCIGGDLLARGYGRRPGLTSERFVADPFSGDGGCLYRTGDLVRWRADGQLEYLGRIDHQVKVRGFRIELGEVEAQLLAQPAVREAVVVAQSSPSGARLVAYVSGPPGGALTSASLHQALSQGLPEYMVPGVIVVLPALPLTPNGKVDRQALPEPELGQEAAYEAPQGEIEQALASVWQEVLGIAQVGRHDNFFELGGDSILSLQIVARARRVGHQLSPKQLFECQSIAALAVVVQVVADAGAAQAGQTDEVAQGEVPLLPIQADFFDREMPARHHWNQAVLLQSNQGLDADLLAQALQALVRHHDSLRLRYGQTRPGAHGTDAPTSGHPSDGASDEPGAWRQTYTALDAGDGERSAQPLLWLRQARDAQDVEQLCAQAQRSLDLEHGPLLRALLIEMHDGGTRLLLAIHHLVVDGVSWRILLEDLQTAYGQLAAGQAITLPPKTASVQAWARRLQAHAQAQGHQLAHWQPLAGTPVSLPCDHPQGEDTEGQQGEVTLRLDRARTQALLKDVPSAYRTQVNEVLLTALGRALCAWSGHEEILIDLEGHGREELARAQGQPDLDLSRTVGWFTSIYPVRLDARGEARDALKRTKDSLRAIPDKGLGHGVLKHLGSVDQRQALQALPQPQVVFNYLGQFDTSFNEASMWRLAPESAGPFVDERCPRDHALAINGQVQSGELSLVLSYSRARHQRATIEALAQAYRHELEGLIAHCTSGASGVTPSDFPLASLTGLSQAQLDEAPMPLAQLQDLYPLSPMQSGMLFHSVYEAGGSGAYIGQTRLDIERLEPVRFKAAWQAAMARHGVLRTGFWHQREVPLQWVAKAVELPLVEHDWRDRLGGGQGGLSHPQIQQDLDQLAQLELTGGFDLMRPPLMRLMLVRTAQDRHHFIWTMHHLLLDGWSTAQLMSEVLRQHDGEALPTQGAPFRDHIGWLQAQDAQASEAYWRGQLRLIDEPTRLLGRPEQTDAASACSAHTVELDEAFTGQLLQLARHERVTLNSVLHAAWAMLLSRRTGRDTVAFGMTTAGRPGDLAGADQMLGLFINTLPMTAQVRPDMPVGEWLRALQAQSLSHREHEHTPLVDIQRWAGQGSEGLFDTIMVFENYPIDEALLAQNTDSIGLSNLASHGGNHYPLTVRLLFADAFEASEAGQPSRLRIDYLYAQDRIELTGVLGIHAQLEALLHGLVADPQAALGNLPNLAPDPADAVGRAPARMDPPEALPVAQAFMSHARKTPAAPALRDESTHWSYGELDAASDRLARRLVAAGMRPDDRVGLHAGRSCEFVLGLLAVLKAGAAYVPLDPALPTDRLAYQLADSRARLLLSTEGAACRLGHTVPVIELAFEPADRQGHGASVSSPSSGTAAWPVPHPHQAACVIYTSGSTGQPKGVVVTHGALANYVQGVLGRLDLPAEVTSMAMVSTVAADLGNTTLFGALCSGRLLHLISAERAFDPDRFGDYMREHGIDVLKIVPSHLQALMQAACPSDVLPRHALIVGGEATPWGLLDQIQQLSPSCRVVNHYGPTETTVGVLTQAADAAWRQSQALPIGQPLPGSTVHVLDGSLNPVPDGMAGELYIGGAGLARGYQGRAALSAERFVPSPFVVGERLYRSGDRVVRLPDGGLSFLGRIDDQVKIRGYRVEPREVAAVLARQPGVAAAEVIVGEGEKGRAQLQAYVVRQADARVDVSACREALSAVLPDYMVPATLTVLDALPLTPNGKVDRRRLPSPHLTTSDDRPFEAPQTETEQFMAAVWSDVLGVPQVGRQDDFFALGGDSILCLKLVARARKRAMKLTPKQVFEHRTLAALAASVSVSGMQAGMPVSDSAGPALVPVKGATRLDLSFAQQRQWFLWQLDPQGTAYHIAGALHLKGGLNVDAVQAAFDDLVARHESLRTSFKADEQGHVKQVIQPQGRAEFSVIDLSQARALAERPFDLAHDALLRVAVIGLSPSEHVLAVVMHHIVSDGWSMQVMVEEFVAAYQARLQDRSPQWPALPIQYADYAAWQRDWLASGEKVRQLAYWREQLSGEGGQGFDQPVLQLATDHPRHAHPHYRAASVTVELPQTLSEALKKRAQAQPQGGTLFTVLLAGWQALLHRHSGLQDIRVGVPIANRHHVETAGVVGLFVNTQVLRNRIGSRLPLQAVLDQACQAALGAQAHQDLPFEQLVEALQPDRSLSHSPLFQVMHNHQRQDRRALAQLDGLAISPCELGDQAAQFELTLDTDEQPDGRVQATLTYARELFEPERIQRLAGHYLQVLGALAHAPQQAVGDVELLDEAELAQLRQWGRNEQRHPDHHLVHELIAQQAAQRPHAPALVFGEQVLNHGQLNQRANQLAHHLIALGVGPDVKVGIAVERSIEMVVGLLAIAKAGGAYVPLDPDYPADRLAYMIEDSGVQLLLTQSHLLPRLPRQRREGLHVIALDKLGLSDQPDHDPQVPLHGDNLAYVIYTSGSTGRPKGAANRHRSLHNRLAWMQQAHGLGTSDTVLQKTPFSFDVSVWEFFWPLMQGARLVVAQPGDHRDPSRLAELIAQHGVTTLHFVPSMLRAFMAHEAGLEACASVTRILCSGEALPAELAHQVLTRLPKAGLHNLYGPTEAAIDVTQWTCVDEGRSSVPIGQPISGTSTLILDADLNLAPPGVAGELYLGGVGLGRGYLGRSAMTSERFVAHPFSQTGERLYRTGDLARWRLDGQIEYLGRLDHQVKIRGLRIELGEIEAQLLSQPEVREAVVVARSSPGGDRLLAYVSCLTDQDTAGQHTDGATLLQRLRQMLPEHMVPSTIMILPSLPLNANGKLDRKALPEPVLSDAQVNEAPQGHIEQTLAAIWCEVLGLDQVGRQAHFFELGGHSLLATRMASRVRLALKVSLPLRLVFEHPVLSRLADSLAACLATDGTREEASAFAVADAVLAPVPRTPAMALSPIQRRLWLVDRLAGGTASGERAAYNMGVALQLSGPLDVGALRAALDALVRRHEVLRTVYPQDEEGDPIAVILPFVPTELVVTDLAMHPAGEQRHHVDVAQAEHAGEAFDLATGPVLRTGLLKLAPERHVLLLAVHHMAFDGWSQSVFAREFAALYQAFRDGVEPTLAPLRIQYTDHAHWQALQLERHQAGHADFWRGYLQGAPEVSTLAPDPAPLAVTASPSAGDVVDLAVPPDLVDGLEHLARSHGCSLFTVLLASFQCLLHERLDADDLVIGTDVAGRHHPDLEGLIGFFVNVVPLRSRRPQGMGFSPWLSRVKQDTLSAFEHESVPFDRILELAGNRFRGRHRLPLVQILFVLQNTPEGRLALPGLSIDTLSPASTRAKFDLAMFVDQDRGGLSARLVYAAGLYRRDTIERLAADWGELLRQVLEAPDTPLDRLALARPRPFNEDPPKKEPNPMTTTATTATPATSKLDKLKRIASRPTTVAVQAPAGRVRMGTLAEGRDFPALIEPIGGDLDAVAWAREHRGAIEALLLKHGGILFRDFGLKTPQDFEAFAEAIEPGLYGGYGDLPKKEGGRNTYRSTPYPEREMILYHNESSHLERWPRKQWFFCELPSPVGGATPIVDGREMLRRLPSALVDELERKQLLYVRTFTRRLDVSWQDFFKTDSRDEVQAKLEAAGIEWRWLANDELQTRTRCPAVIKHPVSGERVFFNQVQLHHVSCLVPDVREDLLAMVGMDRMPRQVYHGDGSPISDETMAVIGQAYEACAVRFQWRQGDVIMLDNMLAAHARDPYEGPRKIVVAMGDMFERSALDAGSITTTGAM